MAGEKTLLMLEMESQAKGLLCSGESGAETGGGGLLVRETTAGGSCAVLGTGVDWV